MVNASLADEVWREEGIPLGASLLGFRRRKGRAIRIDHPAMASLGSIRPAGADQILQARMFKV